MKISHYTCGLLLFILLALVISAFAGNPQTINYQGYLTTTSGVTANPSALAFDGSGSIWVTNFISGSIRKINTATRVVGPAVI